jgi:MFS family permease
MTESTKGILRNVFSNRNILIVSLTTTMWSMCDNGWRTFWPLWMKNEMGASVVIIGMLSMIRDSGPFLFQLPGGILADRFGRKKIIIYGTALRFIPPVLYLTARTWEQTIPALMLDALTQIYMPAFNAIVADSLPSRQRGTGYGAYRMITSLPLVVMPVIGGVVMDSMGYANGVKIFLYAELIVAVAIVILRYKYITETLETKTEKPTDYTTRRESLSSTFNVPRTVWKMAVVSTASSFASRLVMQLAPIYARDVLNITNTELGLASTLGSLISTTLALPGGMLADRTSRKSIILLPMIVSPLATFSVTLVSGFQQYLIVQLINGTVMGIGGGAYGQTGGSAWQALLADLVPRQKRATVNGILGTITGVMAAPSSWIGGSLWETYTPETPFQLSLSFGYVAAAIFGIFVKEPKKGEE